MFQAKLIYLIILLQFLVQIQARSKVPAVIVFGDSSVDAGNNDNIPTIGKSNFPPYGRDFVGGKPTGRFCNGRLSTDFISEAFGLKSVIPAYLDPKYSIKDFATGVTFASAGTGLDTVTSDLVSVIPFWKEIVFFKKYVKDLIIFMGEDTAEITLREAVYILSIGTNDFLENYYVLPKRRLQFTVEEYQDFLLGLIKDFVLEVYKFGARKIALTGLTAFGCLPLERTTNFIGGHACMEEYNKVARDFNVKLNKLIPKLNEELPDITVVYSGVYDILDDAIKNPQKYGFEEVARGCCGTGAIETAILCNKWSLKTCKDASKYIFWDSIHYSEKMNKMVSDFAMKNAFSVFL
ncbi:hypothetical protein ACHQM5_025594 [Ranunculus cassubicifolius]